MSAELVRPITFTFLYYRISCQCLDNSNKLVLFQRDYNFKKLEPDHPYVKKS